MGTQISELTPLHQTTLLKSDQHKESSFLTGLGRGSYSLSPFWDRNGHGYGFSIIFLHFPCILVAASNLGAVMQKSAA